MGKHRRTRIEKNKAEARRIRMRKLQLIRRNEAILRGPATLDVMKKFKLALMYGQIPRCPECGSAAWGHATRGSMTCGGCGWAVSVT
jgi:hypothetical protein